MQKSIQSTTPTLRFPEFSDEWEGGKLGSICEFKQGVQVDLDLQLGKEKEDYVKFLRIENYTQNSQDFRFIPKKYCKDVYTKEDDIVVVRYGATAGFISKGFSGVLANNLFTVKPIEDSILLKSFLFKILKRKKTFQYLQIAMSGGAMPALSFSILKPIIIYFPSNQEQQKIADFLSLVDVWIENLEKRREVLKTYKRGMMQKIFSQEVRFKDKDGKDFPEWKEKRLGEILSYEQPTKYIVDSTEYRNEYEIPVLTAGKTFILGYTKEQDGIFDSNNLPVIIFDDFTTAKKFVDFSFKVKSSAMKILKNRNDDNSDIRYVYSAMTRVKFGLGEEHKRFWISEYSKTKIPFPSLAEQRKIADCLTSLDEIIESEQDEIIKVESWRQGLMQRMFV